jgi:ABC-type multidrug transport system ATPase subunit
MVAIGLHQVAKRYNKQWLFTELDCNIVAGNNTAILGINGSGKSTLLNIITGHIQATKGTVSYQINEQNISHSNIHKYLGYCSPAMELIEEFTLHEFLNTHHLYKPFALPIAEVINYIGLTHAANKRISYYSSGMKQRVKLAQAVINKMPLLCLDEPCSNLDAQGIQLYHKMINDFGKSKTIIVSSNDAQEYAFCQQNINIAQYQHAAKQS